MRLPRGGGDRARRTGDHRADAEHPVVGRPTIGGLPGDIYTSYATRNPVARRLVGRFRRQLVELLERAAPESLIDVGCGEGAFTTELAIRVPGPVRGLDLPDPELRSGWTFNVRPNLEYLVGEAASLPADDGEFDAASAIEVLEHLSDPEAALCEMTRVARRWLIVSVPREPWWRAANVARGAYMRALGNTPGHLNHWTRRGLVALLEAHGVVEELRSPFPWTLALVAL